mgnify:CR=1 FL=1
MILDLSNIDTNKLISTLIVFLTCAILYVSILLVTRQIFINKNKKVYNAINYLSLYLIVFICAIVILNIWLINLYPILIAVGVIAVILCVILQDLLKDVACGIKIISNEIYKEDDIIEVNGYVGKVKSLNLIHTTLVGTTGEVKIVNNSLVKEVKNYSKNLIVGYVDLPLDIKVDTKKAIEIISEQLSSFNELYSKIVEGPNVFGLVDINKHQILRITFKAKYEDLSLLERSIRKELIDVCHKYDIELDW